jgi:hypothetical protein
VFGGIKRQRRISGTGAYRVIDTTASQGGTPFVAATFTPAASASNLHRNHPTGNSPRRLELSRCSTTVATVTSGVSPAKNQT